MLPGFPSLDDLHCIFQDEDICLDYLVESGALERIRNCGNCNRLIK